MVVSAVVGMAAAEAKKAVRKKLAQKGKPSKGAKGGAPAVGRRRRTRLLTMGQREELMWIVRYLGKSAAAERMAHYRR